LADWHKEALRLHAEQGLGARRISDELGESFSAVNSYLYRWRKKNRKNEEMKDDAVNLPYSKSD
jgi:DNA-directed RNA polymerase specialized sigma24 family protein